MSISGKDVIGRDKLVAHMWRKLEQSSVIFTAERRIGKTTVLKKMASESPDGHIVLFSDLEKVDTPHRFVEVVLTDLNNCLPVQAKIGKGLSNFIDTIGGTEIGGIVKIPDRKEKDWQSILEKTLTDACQNRSEQIVFLWDEVPYMLQKIADMERKAKSSRNSALAILDSLRALREENHSLRMVFTGSVGLHHVLNDLRSEKLASQPLNNMEKLEIGPLTSEHATILAQARLEREEIRCNSQLEVAERIAELTDKVPFYILRVVSKLAFFEEEVTPGIVETVVEEQLVDAGDAWEMEHFRNRLSIYYRATLQDTEGNPIKTASIAKILLNHIASEAAPQSIDQCVSSLTSKVRFQDRDEVISILNSLAKDHYLVRDRGGRYQFRFPLVQKWWVIAQGLEAHR